MKITFVAWVNYERRSELLAQHLNATMHFIYYGQEGNVLQAPVRYLIQAFQTLRVLIRERPDIVFVQNPPIFSVLIVFVYCKLFNAKYVIDSHTAAFLSRRWSRFTLLHQWLSRRALLEIVHNKSQEATVQNWKSNYQVIGFTPGDYPEGEFFTFKGLFNIVVPSTFHDDEPFEVVFDAASRLPDVAFYFTGDSASIPPEALIKKPANCYLTGFLPYVQYVGLMRGADVVLDLTTRDGTVLSGAFEAISLGKPMIVSDWQVLRDYFAIGTIHIPNSVNGILNGVRQAQLDIIKLQHDILILQANLQAEWNLNLLELIQRLTEF